MYKKLYLLIKIILGFILFIHLAFYLFYYYKLQNISLEKYQIENFTFYKKDMYQLLWVSMMHPSQNNFNSQQKVQIKGIYLLDVVSILSNYTHPSHQLLQILSTNHIYSQKLNHVERFILKIWMSHHLTFEEASYFALNKISYGNNYVGIEKASIGYFNKHSDELDIYQMIMLHTIIKAPSYFNPRRYPQRVLKEMNKLILALRKVFPVEYKDLKIQKNYSITP